MKIIVNAKEFANIIERASICTTEKSILDSLDCVQISAYNGKVTASASNLAEFVSIFFDAEIIEEGTVRVDLSNWKKLLKAAGRITIESTESTIRVTGDKKKSETFTCQSDLPEIPCTPQGNPLFTAPVEELTEIFKNLQSCVSANESRPACCGYHIYGSSESDQVKFVAVDGFHLLRKTSDYLTSRKFDIVVPGSVNKSLAKIAGKSGNLNIYVNGKHTIFSGKDFTYVIRNIDAKALDENEAIPHSSAGEFKVNAAEIAKISKDYAKTIGKSDITKSPLRLFAGESHVILGMSHNGYATTDEVGISDAYMPNNDSRFRGYFMTMLNSAYAADIFGIFNKDVTVKFDKAYTPLVVESDSYLGLLLPVREGDHDGSDRLAELAGISLAKEIA